MCDYILSGTFVRFPGLKIAYAEGQVGWMPYVIERMAKIWEERGDASFGIDLPDPIWEELGEVAVELGVEVPTV